MADNFEAVEIIYGVISSWGVTTYKDKSPEGIATEHIVVNSPSSGASGYGTNDVSVNINIFIPVTANGMINRSRLKTIRAALRPLIEAAAPAGYYCYVDPEFSALLENAKKGFDCFTMRYLLTLNK